MKSWLWPAILLMVSFPLAGALAQGTLSPPGAPAPTLRTLQQIEPRTPIASLPYTITQPGSYYVESNLTAAVGSSGILIVTNDVALDLQGFTLRGATNSAYGVGMIGVRRNILIRHGTIRGFTVGVDSPGADNSRYEDLRVGSNRGDGLRIGQYGVVENCSVMENGGDGIDGYQGCVMRGCVVSSNTLNGILVGADSTVVDCLAQDNTLAGLRVGDGSTVERCQVLRSGTSGIILYRNSVARECTIQNALQAGILVTNQSNLIELNRVARNGTGLQVTGQNNVIRENQVGQNGVNYDFAANNQLNLRLSEIPETLAWPCAVSLVGTLVCSSNTVNGITVNANDVTIDLAGHALVGPGASSGYGIYQPTSNRNLRVFNGSVINWLGANKAGLSAGRAALVNDLLATTNYLGFYANENSVFTRCVASGNESHGFRLFLGCEAQQCIAQNNAGSGFSGSDGGAYRDCLAIANTNRGYSVGNSTTFSGCVADSNEGPGFWIGYGCALAECSANFNHSYGFRSSDAAFANCIAVYNLDHGFYSDGGTVHHCTAELNQGTGIYLSGIGVVQDCDVSGNEIDGIRVNAGSRVSGCETSVNGLNGVGSGIHVTGQDNVIEDNLSYGSDRGFEVVSSGNFLSRNKASGNSTNWVVAAGNVCLVVQANTNAVAINGNTGGVAPGSTDPNANFTF